MSDETEFKLSPATAEAMRAFGQKLSKQVAGQWAGAEAVAAHAEDALMKAPEFGPIRLPVRPDPDLLRELIAQGERSAKSGRWNFVFTVIAAVTGVAGVVVGVLALLK